MMHTFRIENNSMIRLRSVSNPHKKMKNRKNDVVKAVGN
jgi:hypothetical protein